MPDRDSSDRRPNILLLLSDEERQRNWIPAGLTLPARQRLIDEGLEFTSYYTHTNPCSPSRASLLTGQYLPNHGVTQNVDWIRQPERPHLEPDVPTIGHALRAEGYYSAYLGKWHLSRSQFPDLDAHGFSDWTGDDLTFRGLAGAGLHSDPLITEQAVNWLQTSADREEPWLLVVAMLNPHDVMWFPGDQPDYQHANAETIEQRRGRFEPWREGDLYPAYDEPYEQIFDAPPLNLDDDLFTKPAVQRQYEHDTNLGPWGRIERSDTRAWIRQLDYYWRMHQEHDRYLGRILDALDASGQRDETIVIFSTDHGDMCGAHGLRNKGPFVYEEQMRIPLYIRAPGITTPGSRTAALGSSVDLASTILALGGVEDAPTFMGRDLSPVLRDPSASVRDYVLLAQDLGSATDFPNCLRLRYAMRCIFDGRHKYARYFGVGVERADQGRGLWTRKRFDHNAAFEDHDHEWYDLHEDPLELVNLANDRGRRHELRERFHWLRESEAAEFGEGL